MKQKLLLAIIILASIPILYIGRWFFIPLILCGGAAYLWWKLKRKNKELTE